MMKFIRNILTILVVTLLIAATGGVSVYQHICHCAGEVSSSIFLETSCEVEDPSTSASCCSVEKTPSCCQDKTTNDSKSACHDDDCCQTSSQFLKISDSFQPGLEKISLKSFAIISNILFYDIIADENIKHHLNILNDGQPPPPTGKQIILALHQLKIAPSLV